MGLYRLRDIGEMNTGDKSRSYRTLMPWQMDQIFLSFLLANIYTALLIWARVTTEPGERRENFLTQLFVTEAGNL